MKHLPSQDYLYRAGGLLYRPAAWATECGWPAPKPRERVTPAIDEEWLPSRCPKQEPDLFQNTEKESGAVGKQGDRANSARRKGDSEMPHFDISSTEPQTLAPGIS